MRSDPQENQRRNYILRRSIMDYGMGGLIMCAGLFLIFSHQLMNIDFDLDPLLKYGFASLCIVYGGFRMYRGYKKNYF
ncbi:MAG TPA: hypothetical protein VGM41_10395 [Chitinophagaceae bacterium]|jgi:hypothetical protein